MDACIAACLDEFGGRGKGMHKPNIGLYQLATVLRFTGLRVGQALGLMWSDLDMSTAMLESTVKRLVGHAGGLTSDIYTDPDALGMRKAVALIPPVGKIASLTAVVRKVAGSEKDRGSREHEDHV